MQSTEPTATMADVPEGRNRSRTRRRAALQWQRPKILGIAAVVGVVLAGSMSLLPAAPSYAATFEVTNTADSGPGSLRQVLTDANAAEGTHTITFNIPGAGPHTITPLSALPPVGGSTATVSIDGCTQPGAVCAVGSPPAPMVRIDGVHAGLTHLKSSGAPTIRGLSITGAPRAISGGRSAFAGTFYFGADDVTVEFNLIGLAPDGTAVGNTVGIQCRTTTASAGGPPNTRIIHNVISGNTTAGISCTNTFPFGPSQPVPGLIVDGNLIGLDPTGETARPNGIGVQLANTRDASITGNIIMGNTGNGIATRARSADLLIQDNVVAGNGANGIAFAGGTNLNAFEGPVRVLGNTVSDNAQSGLFASPDVSDVRIGGTDAGEPNEITGNGADGVTVGDTTADTSSMVSIRGNSIDGNADLGIDLANDGVTANAAAGMPRTGPNLQLNHPVITHVERGSTRVVGTYAGAANQTYVLDFFINEVADGTGYGEGAQWIGSGEVTTDSSGMASFDYTFSPTAPVGSVVSSTATDASGNTSEFSADVSVGPIAQDDAGSATVDTPLTLRPLDNDTAGDAPIAPGSLRLIDPSSGAETTTVTVDGGTFAVDPDGTVVFSPDAGYVGAVAPVQYIVSDTNGARSDSAEIAVTVAYAELVAVDDDFTVAPNGGVAGNVLANETLAGQPVNPDDVTITVIEDGHNSGATIAGDGQLSMPANRAPGVYTIRYRICETEYPDNCSVATVRVTVQAPAPAGTAAATTNGLAHTGSDLVPVLPIVAFLSLSGLAALGLGYASSRRRRSTS